MLRGGTLPEEMAEAILAETEGHGTITGTNVCEYDCDLCDVANKLRRIGTSDE